MTNGVIATAAAHSRFPPSFGDSPWAYGFALFGLSIISAMSLAILTGVLIEARRNRQISANIDNQVLPATSPKWTALSLYRVKLACLLLTITIGATPDVLVLLAWGEASESTMTVLFTLDRFGDGFALAPFIAFVATVALSGGAVSHRLALDPYAIDLTPRWSRMRQKLQIALCASLIAIGVTFYKASM